MAGGKKRKAEEPAAKVAVKRKAPKSKDGFRDTKRKKIGSIVYVLRPKDAEAFKIDDLEVVKDWPVPRICEKVYISPTGSPTYQPGQKVSARG